MSLNKQLRTMKCVLKTCEGSMFNMAFGVAVERNHAKIKDLNFYFDRFIKDGLIEITEEKYNGKNVPRITYLGKDILKNIEYLIKITEKQNNSTVPQEKKN